MDTLQIQNECDVSRCDGQTSDRWDQFHHIVIENIFSYKINYLYFIWYGI